MVAAGPWPSQTPRKQLPLADQVGCVCGRQGHRPASARSLCRQPHCRQPHCRQARCRRPGPRLTPSVASRRWLNRSSMSSARTYRYCHVLCDFAVFIPPKRTRSTFPVSPPFMLAKPYLLVASGLCFLLASGPPPTSPPPFTAVFPPRSEARSSLPRLVSPVGGAALIGSARARHPSRSPHGRHIYPQHTHNSS